MATGPDRDRYRLRSVAGTGPHTSWRPFRALGRLDWSVAVQVVPIRLRGLREKAPYAGHLISAWRGRAVQLPNDPLAGLGRAHAAPSSPVREQPRLSLSAPGAGALQHPLGQSRPIERPALARPPSHDLDVTVGRRSSGLLARSRRR